MRQTEDGELKMYNNDVKKTNAENTEISNSMDIPQTYGILSLPNKITGKLSECNNVQFGTLIITSNTNVIDQNNGTSNTENDELKNCLDKSDSNNTTENAYCQIGCEKFEKFLTVLIFFVSVISLFLVVSILIPSFGGKNSSATTPDVATTAIVKDLLSTSSTEATSKDASKTTEKDTNPWLINYEEWSNREQSKTCYKKLPPTDIIKFWNERAICNTFKSCTNMLKQDAFIDIDGCHFDDVIFHFAISEQGLVFKSRSTNCEIPPEYKKCNESVLFIKFYIGSKEFYPKEEECRSSSEFIKQIEGVKNLIYYNRRKGVILEKPLLVYMDKRYCSESLADELNKTFGISDIYESKVVMCPNVNTCIED